MLLLHGDMDQLERNKVITQFKKKEVNILVATDVAGTFADNCCYTLRPVFGLEEEPLSHNYCRQNMGLEILEMSGKSKIPEAWQP